MWSLRRNKTTDNSKVIKEMKEKALQIEKLKNEVTEMGKLILVDGKLQKQEDKPKQLAAPQQKTQEQLIEEKVEQQVQQQMAQRQQRPMVPPPLDMPVPPIMEERQYQQPRAPTQEEIFAYQELNRRNIEEMERQELQRRYQQQTQPQEHLIMIAIELVHGNIVRLQLPMNKFESFVQEMNNAIDNQCSIPVGQKIINGAQVAMYYVVEKDNGE